MPGNFNENQIETALNEHPFLRYDSSKRMFSGTLIIDSHDNDSYSVEIYIDCFPTTFPLVREIGERIPPKADRHKYKDDYCCLTTSAKEQILLKKRIFTLSEFISMVAIPYFQNNTFYEINKRYLFGEYSHGIKGLIEAYKEILGLNCSKSVEKVLIDYAIGNWLSKNQPCYCGSGKLLNNCHLINYNDLCLLSMNFIKQDLNLIFRYS
jgi:hypothetical protein